MTQLFTAEWEDVHSSAWQNKDQAATGGVGLMLSSRVHKAPHRVYQPTATNHNSGYLATLQTEHELLPANTLFQKNNG